MRVVIDVPEARRLFDGLRRSGMIHSLTLKTAIGDESYGEHRLFSSRTGKVRAEVKVEYCGDYEVVVSWFDDGKMTAKVFSGRVYLFGFREGYELKNIKDFVREKIMHYEDE